MGRITSRKHFKRIENTGLFEFKCHQIRMPCYRTAIAGFKKKRDSIATPSLILLLLSGIEFS